MTPASALPPPAAPTIREHAQTLLQQVELTTALPDLLLLDQHGHPVSPSQLGSAQELHHLPEQMGLLTRPEPVGGWSPLLRANRARILAQARTGVQTGLATMTPTPQAFRHAVATAIRAVQTSLDQQADEIEQAYTQTQDLLTRWQERRTSSGTLRGVLGWVLGSDGYGSLPQAISLWNDRERLALKRAATRAAQFIVSQILSEVTTDLHQHQSRITVVQHGLSTVTQRLAELAHAPARGYTPWTWRIHAGAVAEALARPAIPEQALTDLLTTDLSDPPGDLLIQVQLLARQEANRRQTGLDIIAFIEQEAHLSPLADTDPVLLVGQALLDNLIRRQAWRLSPAAQPRIATLQLTATGEPIYALDGLHTATSGLGADRLGMLQIQLEVALEEVLDWSGDDAAFQIVLQQRNLYVLETLARQHAPVPPPMESLHTAPEVVAEAPPLVSPLPLPAVPRSAAETLPGSNGVRLSEETTEVPHA